MWINTLATAFLLRILQNVALFFREIILSTTYLFSKINRKTLNILNSLILSKSKTFIILQGDNGLVVNSLIQAGDRGCDNQTVITSKCDNSCQPNRSEDSCRKKNISYVVDDFEHCIHEPSRSVSLTHT